MKLDNVLKYCGFVIGGKLGNEKLSELDIVTCLNRDPKGLEGLALVIDSDTKRTKVIIKDNLKDKLIRFLANDKYNSLEIEDLVAMVDSAIPLTNEIKAISDVTERVIKYIEHLDELSLKTYNELKEELLDE